MFEKSSSTIETDLQPNSPTEAFPKDKYYETMQGGTQSQVPNVFFRELMKMSAGGSIIKKIDYK